MFLFGLLLIALGVGAVVLAHGRRDQVHTMIGADRLTVAELDQERDILVELGTTGGFSRICEVTGYAHPHDDGPLTSPQTGTECVWYRHTVRQQGQDDSGLHLVHEESSDQDYVLVAETGNIVVDPSGTVPVLPEHVGSRFVPSGFAGGRGWDVPGGAGWRPRGQDQGVHGDQHDEWVIRAGSPLYVHGEVHDRHGPLVVGLPESGTDPFIVSTRSELDLRADSTLLQRRWAWGGATSGAVGLAVCVLALVS